jgi:hypothetical protein
MIPIQPVCLQSSTTPLLAYMARKRGAGASPAQQSAEFNFAKRLARAVVLDAAKNGLRSHEGSQSQLYLAGLQLECDTSDEVGLAAGALHTHQELASCELVAACFGWQTSSVHASMLWPPDMGTAHDVSLNS